MAPRGGPVFVRSRATCGDSGGMRQCEGAWGCGRPMYARYQVSQVPHPNVNTIVQSFLTSRK